jgi:Outer membrane protein
VQVNSAKTSLIRSQREFEAAGYGLAALMGLPEATFPPNLRLEALDKARAATSSKEKTEQLIQDALATRPDVRRLEKCGQTDGCRHRHGQGPLLSQGAYCRSP